MKGDCHQLLFGRKSGEHVGYYLTLGREEKISQNCSCVVGDWIVSTGIPKYKKCTFLAECLLKGIPWRSALPTALMFMHRQL